MQLCEWFHKFWQLLCRSKFVTVVPIRYHQHQHTQSTVRHGWVTDSLDNLQLPETHFTFTWSYQQSWVHSSKMCELGKCKTLQASNHQPLANVSCVVLLPLAYLHTILSWQHHWMRVILFAWLSCLSKLSRKAVFTLNTKILAWASAMKQQWKI